MKKVLSFLAIAAVVSLVACQKSNPKKPSKEQDQKEQEQEKEQEPEYVVPITIDGDFADWAKLDASKVASAKCDPNALYTAVKEIRCYSDELYVFYYIEFDETQLKDLMAATNDPADPEHNALPIRLDINTDGEFESGYNKYFIEMYDFIIEGGIAQSGQWVSFDGDLLQRIDGSWYEKPLVPAGSGMVAGAGKDNKYEISVIRESFNAGCGTSPAPKPMGEEFQTGITFYTPSWGELGGMPNAAVSDDDAKGWGHMLTVKTVSVN